MSILKKSAAVAALLIFTASAAYYYAPYLAVKRFGEALIARDAAEVSRRIDFETLRANIRPQAEHIANRIGIQHAPRGNDPFSGFAQSMAGSMAIQKANALITTSVTPEGVAAALHSSGGGTPFFDDQAALVRMMENAEYRRAGSLFAVTLRDPNNASDAMRLIFARYGMFTWRLAGMDLPVDRIVAALTPAPRPQGARPSVQWRNPPVQRGLRR